MNDIVNQREATHGDFTKTAHIAQQIKSAFRVSPAWFNLSSVQREALDNMAVKQARIVCGDPNFPDHWDDIIGYATLGK